MNNVKIMVAIPHTGYVEPMVYERLFMQEDVNGSRLDMACVDLIHFDNGYGIDEKRNMIVRRLLSHTKYTHVLMLDSDVVMPLDAIARMLEEDLDVVSGFYARKNYPTLSCVVPRGSDLSTSMPMSDIAGEKSPFMVKAVGMGCVLIKRGVFEKVKSPWFKYMVYEDRMTLSEDYNFCINCTVSGIDVYVHPRVRCGHVKKGVL